MMKRALWAIAAIAVAGQATAAIEQDLAACAAIADKKDRLGCYDELARSVVGDADSSEPTAQPEPERAQASAESEFGKLEREVREKPKKQDLDKVYLEVGSIDKDPYGALIIGFTNGQLWKQIDHRSFSLGVGETVFIEKGILRSYVLGSDAHNVTIRVKRIR